MKYIKLYEAIDYISKYRKLKEKLGIGEIQSDIKDVIQELIDDLDPSYISGKEEIVKIIYKKNARRKTGINIPYYDRYLMQPKMPAVDGNNLLNTIEAINFSETINYVYKQYIKIKNPNEPHNFWEKNISLLKRIENALSTTQKRLNAIGYDFTVSYNGFSLYHFYEWKDGTKKNEESIKNFIEEANDKDMKWKFADFPRYDELGFYIYIIADIDTGDQKITIDKSPLPTHLQTKFDEFVKKHRLSTTAQKELINWFKSENKE